MKSLSFRKDLVGVQDELLRFAYKLTTDREEANDLLQETSLKALDNEDKYTPDTNFKGWMYTIMRNLFINNYENKNKRSKHMLKKAVVDCRCMSDDLFFSFCICCICSQ